MTKRLIFDKYALNKKGRIFSTNLLDNSINTVTESNSRSYYNSKNGKNAITKISSVKTPKAKQYRSSQRVEQTDFIHTLNIDKSLQGEQLLKKCYIELKKLGYDASYTVFLKKHKVNNTISKGTYKRTYKLMKKRLKNGNS